MKKNQDQIALLGTSADPPTCGHQALLEGLLKLFPKVVTWASNNPMKQHGASLSNREILLKTLVVAIANPNLEVVQELSSPWTLTSLKKASILWPNKNLVFVIGSDLCEQIPSWFQINEVLQNTHLGIVPREGWPVEKSHLDALKSLGAQIEVLPLQIPGSASSSIRNDKKTTEVPPVLMPVLVKHNLYDLKAN